MVRFPTVQDSATFWDKGTVVPSLSHDKGKSSKSCHRMGRTRTAYQNPGQDTGRDTGWDTGRDTGQDGRRDGTWDKMQDKTQGGTRDAGRDTGQDGTGQDNRYFFPMISCFRTSFPILKCNFPVLEHPFQFFFFF